MSTTLIPSTDISTFHVSKREKGQHGNLFWSITSGKENKAHPRIQMATNKNPLKAPFGLTSFGETSGRQNLDISVDDAETQDFFTALDKWVTEHVWENVKEFFPKKAPASKEQLRDMYCPLLSQKNPSFDPLLRTKVNSSCLVFNIENGSHKGTLEDILPGSLVVPIVSVSKLWTMSGRFGCTLVSEAVMVWPKKPKSIDDIFFRSSDDVENETVFQNV
jgi:hypothetical protein